MNAHLQVLSKDESTENEKMKDSPFHQINYVEDSLRFAQSPGRIYVATSLKQRLRAERVLAEALNPDTLLAKSEIVH